MRDKKKRKELLTGKRFFEGIKSWRKQILEFRNLRYSLKCNKAELKKFPQKLENQVETRTATERMIDKRLLHEIEKREQAERAIQDALEYSHGIIDTVREPLLVLDGDLRVISASRSFYQVFREKPKETEGEFIYFLGYRQWDIPKLRELLEDILPRATSFDGFEVEHNFPDIGRRTMLLNARQIYQKATRAKFILLAIEDITVRKQLEEKLKTLATHDELTGCVNFSSGMRLLENEIARYRRYQQKFSIIMIDIDDFKRVNDEYGHLVGNDALVAFADVIKNSVRDIDVVCRYGGEEFIIVFPESEPQHALVVLERIRESLEKIKITSPHLEKDKEFTLKFSAGIAAFPNNARDLKELLWSVDSALRQAKREGKNRAVLERRKLIRFYPSPGTRIERVDSYGQENVKALKIANISKEGMSLFSTQEIPGEELLCRIYSPEDESPFELTCKVKYQGKSESELYRLGVYFPDIPESIKEKLSHCIESPKDN